MNQFRCTDHKGCFIGEWPEIDFILENDPWMTWHGLHIGEWPNMDFILENDPTFWGMTRHGLHIHLIGHINGCLNTPSICDYNCDPNTNFIHVYLQFCLNKWDAMDVKYKLRLIVLLLENERSYSTWCNLCPIVRAVKQDGSLAENCYIDTKDVLLLRDLSCEWVGHEITK